MTKRLGLSRFPCPSNVEPRVADIRYTPPLRVSFWRGGYTSHPASYDANPLLFFNFSHSVQLITANSFIHNTADSEHVIGTSNARFYLERLKTRVFDSKILEAVSNRIGWLEAVGKRPISHNQTTYTTSANPAKQQLHCHQSGSTCELL